MSGLGSVFKRKPPQQSSSHWETITVLSVQGLPVARAQVTLESANYTTDGLGRVRVAVGRTSGTETFQIAAAGYQTQRVDRLVCRTDCEQPAIRLVPSSVDPSAIPIGKLLAIRGSIFSSYYPCSQGIRPNQPDNINVLGDGLRFGLDERAKMLAAYKARKYTHVDVSFGPANQGYHNLYESLPAIWDEPDTWADFLQWLYDGGVIPVAWLTWDNAPLDATGVNDPRYLEVLKSPRFQKLIRLTVPYGWEPNSGGKYDISNQQYCDRFAWAKSVFPNAVHLLHLATDCDAPIGGDQEPRDLIAMGKSEWWRRVNAAGCDGWLDQINGWFDTGPGITDAFKVNLEQRVRDISHRFASGEWGDGHMLYYGAEYAAYNVFHQPHGDKRWDEDGAKAVGDLFMQFGSRGYFDSGTVDVPDVVR